MGRNATDVDAEHAREELLAGLDHARRLADEGRVREALAICVRLKAVAPTHPELLGLLGTLYARNGRLGPALAHLAEALLHAQRDSRLLWELAQVYLQAGAPVHALHSLRSYRAERRQIPVLHDLPDPEELITHLAAFMHAEAGVATLPAEAQDRAMMAAERGRLRLLFNDDPDKAVSDLREAMRIAPRYPQPRNNLSLALFYSGQPAAAIEMLETTLRDIAPDNVYALATLAFVRWAEGAAPDTQRPQVQRAAGCLHPGSRLLDRTRVAEVAGTLGAHDLALGVLPDPATLVDPAVELGTGRAEQDAARRLRATALANLGDVESALALLRDSPGWTADPLTRRLLTALDQIETLPAPAGGGYPYLGWTDLLSGHYLRRLLAGPAAGRLHFRAPVPPPPDEICCPHPADLPAPASGLRDPDLDGRAHAREPGRDPAGARADARRRRAARRPPARHRGQLLGPAGRRLRAPRQQLSAQRHHGAVLDRHRLGRNPPVPALPPASPPVPPATHRGGALTATGHVA